MSTDAPGVPYSIRLPGGGIHEFVMIAGGFSPFEAASNACSIYDTTAPDPLSGQMGRWSRAPHLLSPRAHAGSPVALPPSPQLPSGGILVVGGWIGPNDNQNYPSMEMSTSSAEIFDLASGTWSYTDKLPVCTPSANELQLNLGAHTSEFAARRMFHQTALLPDGRVLVVGGLGPYTVPIVQNTPLAGLGARSSCLIFDNSKPPGAKWTQTGSLNVPAIAPFVKVHPNGLVFKTSGLDQNFQSSVATEWFNPADGSWRKTVDIPSMIQGPPDRNLPIVNGLEVYSMADILDDGLVLIAFGSDPTAEATDNGGQELAPGRAGVHSALFAPGGPIV